MEKYKNRGSDSGVSAFEIAENSITVQFTTGATYLYSYESSGSVHIEEMKSLATNGHGLNSYIMRKVKNNYAAILR